MHGLFDCTRQDVENSHIHTELFPRPVLHRFNESGPEDARRHGKHSDSHSRGNGGYGLAQPGKA